MNTGTGECLSLRREHTINTADAYDIVPLLLLLLLLLLRCDIAVTGCSHRLLWRHILPLQPPQYPEKYASLIFVSHNYISSLVFR
jgi:hypothetical protein